MFTGIVKALGTVAAIERRGGDMRFCFESADLAWSSYAVGDSISVNGVCLTAVALSDTGFATDVSLETLEVTSLGQLAVDSSVNLEPALRVGERLGGHFVSGHVDCIAQVSTLSADARSTRLSIELPAEYARFIAKKGSVCIDGVSLTINEVSGNSFELNIIPHTTEHTIIGAYAVGSIVNIEVDLLARYLERLLGKEGGGIDEDFLREHGYV